MSKVITAAKQVWSAKDQITRNIWLAGLGAYDKGYQSASNTVNKSQSIFDELVERGRKLESDTTLTITTNKDKLASVGKSTTGAIQEKVQSAVTSFTHIDANTFDNIIDKIEQIEKALEDAKLDQSKPAAEVEVIQEIVDKVEATVTEKVATVAAEVTTTVETVAEVITEVAAKVAPVVKEVVAPVTASAAELVKEEVQSIESVKQNAKKVTKRVKKAAAKKKQ
ncbi:phasin family protein [Moritella sp. 24]|uniref:phasin-related domain-containing protein n=1 Tax=Moritella sp. 24 TaxID=2746230 RepID=UPI001BACF0D8|nr:phasin family protein [Moritella sp. 24]QUM76563.1 phasin family protein [Moritella sp. 24]